MKRDKMGWGGGVRVRVKGLVYRLGKVGQGT